MASLRLSRRRPDPSPGDPERPLASYYVSRARDYGKTLKSSVHFKYALGNAVCGLFPDFVSGPLRERVYREIGFRIGPHAFIMGNLRLTGAGPAFYDNLVIGANAMIAEHVTINLDGRVSIGSNVALGPEVVIYTATHRIGPGSRRLGALASLPVTIEDGAWVRLGAVVVPGVTIGRGSIVAAGAVVLRDVPPNTYVEGNPATVIRKLGWGDR
jgi:acetyltransferase-like isoleucine patch superfamily enzyme